MEVAVRAEVEPLRSQLWLRSRLRVSTVKVRLGSESRSADRDIGGQG